MLNGIMTAISVLTILGGAYIVAESFMSDSTFMRIHRRTAPAVERMFAALNALGMAVFDVARIDLASARDKLRTSRSNRAESYDQLCRKYADTLPAFSDETKRIMRREDHWPEPRRNKDFFGHHGVVSGIWDDSPHYGPKAPGLMRVWGEREPEAIIRGERPSSYFRRRYGQIASVKPNNETEAVRQMKALQEKVRKLNSAGVYIGYGSHPMDKPLVESDSEDMDVLTGYDDTVKFQRYNR